MKKYQNKLNKLDKELNYLPLHEQVIAINNIITNLENGKILQKSPNSLGFLPDSLDIMIEKTARSEKAQEANNLLNNFRSFLSREYGIWSLPNLETAKLIKQEYGVKSSLEIMAGNAYWSKALSEVGIKAIASDSFAWAKSSTTGEAPIFETENLDAISAIKKHPEVDLIICSWAPNFGEISLIFIVSLIISQFYYLLVKNLEQQILLLFGKKQELRLIKRLIRVFKALISLMKRCLK